MTMLDVVFLLMMITAVIKGLRNGLIVAVFSIIGWILGLYAALKFSDALAELLKDSFNISERWLSIIAFVLIFAAVTLIIGLGAKLVEKTFEIALMGWINRIGGIFFYVLLYALIFSVIVYFADKVKLLSEETISSSKVYPIIEPIIITLKQLL